jgi:hypothetical protein
MIYREKAELYDRELGKFCEQACSDSDYNKISVLLHAFLYPINSKLLFTGDPAPLKNADLKVQSVNYVAVKTIVNYGIVYWMSLIQSSWPPHNIAPTLLY